MPDKKINKKILIVEDEDSLLKVLHEIFIDEGFNVLIAKDGEDGLKIALRDHPDMILLDLVMPKKDGITFLKELREDEWGKSATVIVLSNLKDAEEVSVALEQKAFDFLIKTDWKLEDVVKKVKLKLGVK